MPRIVVRNLDEQVRTVLCRKAELHGRFLEQELLAILTAAAKFTPEERGALARRVRSLTPASVPQTGSAMLLRQDRDAG